MSVYPFRRVAMPALCCAVALGGCHSSTDVTSSDAGVAFDARGDAPGVDARLVDAAADAPWVFPNRDAGPLPPARGTLFALRYGEPTFVVDELDHTFAPVAPSIAVPGASPAPFGYSLHSSRDGSVYVAAHRMLADGTTVLEAHSVDLEARTWTTRELPSDLGDRFVLVGHDWVFLVYDEATATSRLVRWNDIVQREAECPIDTALADLQLGGDGYLYVTDPARGVWSAFDPIDLVLVRTISVRGRRIDSDGTSVDGTPRRWYPDSTFDQGPRTIPNPRRVHAIARDGSFVVEDIYANAWIVDRNLEIVAHGEWSGLDKPFAYAWADPAAR